MDPPTTLTYSRLPSLNLLLDIHIPTSLPLGAHPALIFFHGGGIVTGNRECLRGQQWLIEVCARNKWMFVSADYRLLHPSSGFDIISDVKALFAFLSNPKNLAPSLPTNVSLDIEKLVVSGESGGGYPALAAALYATPRPKGLLQQYTMSGNLLTSFYLSPKPSSTPSPYLEYHDKAGLEAVLKSKAEVADDAVPYMCFRSGTGSARGGLLGLWWREGTFVDAVVGRTGFSAKLRGVEGVKEREEMVEGREREAVLQLGVKALGKEFPSTMFLHGKEDTMVLAGESEFLHDRIKEVGGKSELLLVEGVGHGLLDEDELKEMRDPLIWGEEAKKAWRRSEEWMIELVK